MGDTGGMTDPETYPVWGLLAVAAGRLWAAPLGADLDLADPAWVEVGPCPARLEALDWVPRIEPRR